MDTLDANLIEAARSELAVYSRRTPEVVALASVASLARAVEPELLRALRVGLGTRISGTRLSVSAESTLWFSDLVESRGADAITLRPEVLYVLRPKLATDRQLLEDARTIVEDCHKSAPDVLQWEERIVYLALTGRTAMLEEETWRGLRSVSQGMRQPLVNWISDMWLRLPSEATSNPVLNKLYQYNSGLLRRKPQTASGGETSATDSLLDFSSFPTRELGVVLRDDRFIIGHLPEAEFGIEVPDLNPVELDVAFGTSSDWVEQRKVERGQVAEIVIPNGDTIRVRTLAGHVHELAVSFFQPEKPKGLKPKVFINYSHDSPQHRDRVLELSERLRADGVETILDQYVAGGNPAQGWFQWQEDQIEKADYVVVVCTEIFYRRFVKDPRQPQREWPDWEVDVTAKRITSPRDRGKFIPVYLTRADENWLPIALHGSTYYDLTSLEGYRELLRHLNEPPRAREPLAEESRTEISERLSAVDIFAPLSVEEIENLAAAAVRHIFAPGEFVIRAGDQGASMFVLHRGRVTVQVDEDGEARTVAVLGEGAFFGEMALFTGEPRTADIVALEETEVLEIGRAAMKHLFETNPDLAESISWTIAERREGLQASSQRTAKNAKTQQERLLNSIKRFFQDKDAAPPSGMYDISRIMKYAPAELVGREQEVKALEDLWEKAVRDETSRVHILILVGLGGEGKTSLVAKWTADLAHRDWPACDAAFAWSFYSQGASDRVLASSDGFLKEALTFFGDPDMANSSMPAFEKGRRLAHLVGERRTLLILDGVEPLQYPPTSPMSGELKDQGVSALLKTLAASNRGMCIITTRHSIADMRAFRDTSVIELTLERLSRAAGVSLLRRLGVRGTEAEFETLVDEVKGHALTLNLVGNFLRDAHGGDIRKRDLLNLEPTDGEEFGNMYAPYIRGLESEGERGERAVALLRLLGLFDRPATIDSLNALWQGEIITGLTEPLLSLSEAQRNISLTRLAEAKLVILNRASYGEITSIDTPPMLRGYLAQQLRTKQPEAWREAHRRLYEHFSETTADRSEPTLEDLEPLGQAVRSGCEAGLHQKAFDDVYVQRMQRGNEGYVWRKLGAFGFDLGVIANFFEQYWLTLSPALSQIAQAFLLHNAAFDLRALGRSTEALDPMRTALALQITQSDWKNAATSAGNLSELELTLGDTSGAVRDAEQGISFADRSTDGFQFVARRENLADAYHQSGKLSQAEKLFFDAEHMQARRQPKTPLLYSVGGFRYCDLLLSQPERAAWRVKLHLKPRQSDFKSLAAKCEAVIDRTSQTLRWIAEYGRDLLSPALDHLSLARAAIYLTILGDRRPELRSEIDAAVNGLRRAGQQHYLPYVLLTRAWARTLTGESGVEGDLEEAWEIAERGPMRLHMADIHLYRARLFHAAKPYPWNKFPDGSGGRGRKEDLAAARKLIEQCGYWRRKEELEDAEEAVKNWGSS